MQPDVSYTSYAKSSKEKTGYIITFAQFEEVNLLSETRDDTEICNEYDENSTIVPLIREEEMYAMSSGDESNAKPM